MTNTTLEDDGTIVVDPRSGNPARQIVVVLHGYGADGHDLVPLTDMWNSLLPETAFVVPHAPEPCAGAPVGRQWFPLRTLDPHELSRGVTHAEPGLHAILDRTLSRFGLTDSNMALFGFSQGAMMALRVGLGRQMAPAAVAAYSGVHIASASQSMMIEKVPPVMLTHGGRDDVIPAQALFASCQSLAAVGASVEWHLSEALGHGIDDLGIWRAGHFFSQCFAGN